MRNDCEHERRLPDVSWRSKAHPPEAEPLLAQLLAGEGAPSLFPVLNERGQGLPHPQLRKLHSLDACPVEYPEGNHIQRGQSRCGSSGSLTCEVGETSETGKTAGRRQRAASSRQQNFELLRIGI